ncbi:tetratricopeptide repeat protein [Flavobacterium sp.]|uniref:tetratricopeptide repeat protein n=1 Tax=Flavobacterium sp. TaxID=239 RepID=UPI0025C3C303|nr:tetratricopeptide repeat protein [Flavobacterium sp.]MBA4155714.1 hypothetical protein [Flavobacterium sp.]
MIDITNLFKKVDEFSDKKKYHEALQLCSEAIKDNSDNQRLYKKRYHIYLKMGQWEDALKDMDIVLNFIPQEPADFFNRGRTYLRLNYLQKSYDDLTKAIELGNYYQDHYYTEMTYFFRAECQLRLGRFDEALSDCEHVRPDMQTFIHPKIKSKDDIVREANARIMP